MVATATLQERSSPLLRECMLRQQGTGLSLRQNVMNHLPLIKKSFCSKESLHKAELILTSKLSQTNSAKLNSLLIEQKAKAKKRHKLELLLASKPSHCSSAQLNSRLAIKAEKVKRLHEAQILSMMK